MKRDRFAWLVCALTVVAGVLPSGCRDYDRTYSVTAPRKHNDPPGNPPVRHDPMPIMGTELPRPDEPQPVIAGIYLVAGCTINPEEMAVAADHDDVESCEHIRATAYTGTNGDMDEYGAPITWSVANWSDLSLDCIGNQSNLCSVRMTQDYYDVGDTEPANLVTACTTNDCAPSDTSCEPTVCASVTVKAAINLEGLWLFDPISEPPGLLLDIWQTGRTIFAASNDVEHAFISGFSLRFDRGDYRYVGTIAPDRTHIEGYSFDLISYLPAGSWSASRL